MSTLAEQVVEQLKTDMDNVYDAGYQKGLKEIGGLDVSKFGIQNEVTGTGLVTLDYVNENEHNVEVKLSSDTVTDFSGVTVKAYGKNLFYKSNEYRATCDIPLRAGTTIICSAENDFSSSVDIIFTDGTNYQLGMSYTSENRKHSIAYTPEKDVKQIMFRMTALEPQVEISSFITDYEPCNEKTYIANADGTVDGVTSISPIMSIICDSVDISTKYYCVQDVEWHRFWDGFQIFGTNKNYRKAFGNSQWTNEIFRPKYDFIVEYNSYQMFEDSVLEGSLTELLNRAGVQLKFVNNSYFSATFGKSLFTEIDFNIENCGNIATAFQNCERLKTLKIATLLNTQTIGQNNFQNCIALENLTIVGEIGSTNFNVQWSSLLSVESAKNIIRRLVNHIDTNPFAYTITFHADVWAKLDAEGNTSPNGNGWKDYIQDIGWNYG